MNQLASCQNEDCKSSSTCKRFNNDNATIKFSSYYNEDDGKCEYYVKQDLDLQK